MPHGFYTCAVSCEIFLNMKIVLRLLEMPMLVTDEHQVHVRWSFEDPVVISSQMSVSGSFDGRKDNNNTTSHLMESHYVIQHAVLLVGYLLYQ